MKRPAYLIDAFTNQKFAGNQAAVCLFEKPLEDAKYQKIAAEFNLSETAYPISLENGNDFKTTGLFSLRWFTPTSEVPLCGHATLATAHALFNEIGNSNRSLTFRTLSGDLLVSKGESGQMIMDFPQYEITHVPCPDIPSQFNDSFAEFKASETDLLMIQKLIRELVPKNLKIIGVTLAPKAKKLLVVLDSEVTSAEFATITKDHPLLELHPDGSLVKGIIVTMAPKKPVKQGFVDVNGRPYDYICRYFAPWYGILEDPATGSAQCALGPFWSRVLDKKEMYGLQAFPGRGAQFNVSLEENERISIAGNAVTVISGEIDLS